MMDDVTSQNLPDVPVLYEKDVHVVVGEFWQVVKIDSASIQVLV